jgi:ribosomal protein S18 acetylase RimI-like enzyme
MDVTIRTGRLDDVPPVLTLWADDDVEPTVTDDHESVVRLIDHDPDAFIVAEHDGEIIGSLLATWDGWRASMFRLAVQPNHRRRRGIARALVEHAEQRFHHLGARRITCFAATTDPGPVRFWTELGYHPQTRRQRLVKNLDPRPADR